MRGGDDATKERTLEARKTRLRRLLPRVAVAILSLYALYVVAINAFLSTSLFAKVVNGNPETLFVTYERGWSIWPGRIEARHLVIRSSDSNVQWILGIDRVDFDVSFLAFARKQFHVTRVHGSGVTFDGRQRIPAPEATPEYVDALPEVAGFPRIPLKPPPGDDRDVWDDRYYHLWTVHLENVTADDVREIWVDTIRFDGDARVVGGFYLKPIRRVWVGPAHVDIHGGRTTVMKRLVAEPLSGALDVHLATFDPRVTSGADLLHHLSAATDLRGRLPDLANLPKSLAGGRVQLTGAADVRRLAIRVADGVVTKDSHADVGLPGASFTLAGHRVAGDLTVVADVPSDAGPARLAFHVDGRGLTVDRTASGDRALLFRAPALDVTGDATALDLAAPLRDLHVVAVLPDGDMPDARVLGRYVPPGASVGFEGGHAQAHARVEAWLGERRAKGEGGLAARDLALRIAKTRLDGGTIIDASFGAFRWEQKRLEDVHARVHVADGSIATREAPKTHLVDVRGFAIGVDAAEVDLDDPMRAFDAKVELPHGEIVARGLLRRYLPRGDEMKIARGHARFDLRCELEVRDHLGKGTLDLHAKQLGFVLEKLDLSTDVRAHASVHDWAWERGDLVVDDARVDLTRASVRRRGASDAVLVVPRIAMHARSERFAFSDPLGHVVLAAKITRGEVRDPVALNAFLPPGSDVLFDAEPGRGRFEASLDATIDRHVARGTITARGQRVGVKGKNLQVRGDVDVSASVAEWRLDEHKLRVNSSKATVDGVAVQFGETNPDRAQQPAGAPGPSPIRPDLEAKRIELCASVDDFDIAHPSLRRMDYRLVLDDARMKDARRLGALFSSKRSAGGPEERSVFAVESGSARATADIMVSASQKTASGGAWIAFDGAGVRFHETHLAGDFQVIAGVNGYEPEADVIDVSGSRILMRDVRTEGAAAETTAWDGELVLARGALRVGGAPSFDGVVQLRGDDAAPILALALRNSIPKFLVGLVRAPNLTGRARILVEPGRAALLDVDVRGGDIELAGDYAVASHHARGALTVAKGPFSAGVKLDDEGAHVRFFGLAGWRAEEKHAVMALLEEGKANADAKAKADASAKAKAKAHEEN